MSPEESSGSQPPRLPPAGHLPPGMMPPAEAPPGTVSPGSPPLPGPITVQNREWFACPPPLLRTAPRMSSGTAFRSLMSASTLFASRSALPAIALLTLLMYVW